MNASSQQIIVSQYIANPYLINGYKFDIRIYVLVTSVSPLRIYIYDEGLVRFATEKYNTGNTDNRYIHLTNYAVNKLNKNFIHNTDAFTECEGSKWSLAGLKKYFESVVSHEN
jgi:hypothetical protein